MPRVLFVSANARLGGAERAFAALVRRLPALGVEPFVVLEEDGPLRASLGEAEYAVEPGGPAPVAQLARRVRARAVLSNGWRGHVCGGAAAAAARVPAVCWHHDSTPPSPQELQALALPAAAVVCGSDFSAAAQRRLAPGLAVRRIDLGVPVAEIRRWRGHGRRIRRALGWDGHPIIGAVGRIQRWKGQEVFLRAAALVAEELPHARYVVVGGPILGTEGTFPGRLAALRAELGLAERVHFAGHQPNPYPWLDALDVVVSPSYGESFGLVQVEAMALGKALVTTAVGGPSETVQHERSGLLVPPGRPEPLAIAIRRLLSEPGLAARLGRGGAERALAFDERRMSSEFAALLHDVIAMPRGG